MPKWKRDDRSDLMAASEGRPAPPGADGATRGRPAATSRQDVARAALDLFARQGYDETTVDEIAAAVGISRRTFFRYYESKPDVVWGEFDAELGRLRDRLAEAPDGEPLMDVLRRSVIATNRFGAGELDELRIRMVLISTVPTLVAHSAVRYEEWCDVVAGFAAAPARRVAGRPRPPDGRPGVPRGGDGGLRLLGRGSGNDLVAEVDRAFRLLATGFTGGGPRRPEAPGRLRRGPSGSPDRRVDGAGGGAMLVA